MKVKREFLEKKIEKFKEDILMIPTQTTKCEGNIFNANTILYNIEEKNVQIGNYYFFEDGTYYNYNTLELFKTKELIEDFKIAMSKSNKPFKNGNSMFSLLELFSYAQSLFVDMLYIDNVIKLSDKKVAELTDENKDVIYIRDIKYLSRLNVSGDNCKISDIPLEKFTLVFNFDIETFRFKENEKQRTVAIIETVANITQINRTNVDEKLFNYYCDENGKIQSDMQNYYDNLYNEIYSNDKKAYLIDVGIKFSVDMVNKHVNEREVLLWLDDSISSKNAMDEQDALFCLVERLRFLSQYFRNLEDYGKIDLRIFENEKTKKSGWKIETRKSTIVKSHVRRYKTGTITIVRTHARGGTNYEKGMCLTF
ncbi:MAG: hypothetical protein ACRC92_21735 [Peptostreptococcaceae bacterium]